MAQSQITPQEVAKIAQLGRLGLTSDEVSAATNHLSDILGHFASIQNIDTNQVTPLTDASGRQNITRPDTADQNALCSPQDVLAKAPQLHQGQVKVKAVFS